MSPELYAIASVIAGMTLMFFLSGAETAALSANRRLFREASATGDRSAGEMMDFLGDLRRILNATLAGKILALAAVALGLRGGAAAIWPALVSPPLAWSFLSLADIIAIALAPGLLLIASEATARPLLRKHADRAIPILARPLKLLAASFDPLVRAIETALRPLLAPIGGPAGQSYNRADLARLLENGAMEPDAKSPEEQASRGVVLDTAGRPMIHNIVELEKTRIVEIMRPLIDVVAIRLGETSVEGMLDLARRTGYSKFPVYRDRVINLEGFVSVYDVLGHGGDSEKRLEDYVSSAYYAPEVMRVNELLRQFLEHRLPAAIVVDEYGACSGWITREDLMEEIVGDIEDEFDQRQPIELVRDESGGFVCDGQMDIDDLNEALPARFPKDGFETLGGWICDALGRLPATGDSARFEDYRVEVLKMQGAVIKQVRLKRIGEER